MYRAKPCSPSPVHKRLTVFQRKPDVSRCFWRAYTVAFVIQLDHLWKLQCRLLYMQWLNNFVQEQSEHKRNSQSGKLKLSDHITL